MASRAFSTLFITSAICLNLVNADSSVFSQFVGATTASPPVQTGLLASDFTICTNYIHGLPALAGLSPALSTQVVQEAVDGVCEICSSVGISRIQSCCAASTSSACFENFGAGTVAQTTDQNTAPSSTAAVTGSQTAGQSAVAPTKSSDAGRTFQVNILVEFLFAMAFGLVL